MKKFKLLRKTLKVLGIFLATNMVVLLGIITLVLANPDWVLNERTLKFLANLVQVKKVIHLTWEHATTHVHSNLLKPEVFDFSFINLCAATPSEEQKACWKNAALSFKIGFSGFKPKLTTIGPVQLSEGVLTLSPQPNRQQSPPPDSTLEFNTQWLEITSAFGFFKNISISNISISLNHKQANFILQANGDRLDLASKIKVKNWALDQKNSLNGSIHVDVAVAKNHAKILGKATGQLSTKSLPKQKAISATLRGEILDLKNLDQIQINLDGLGRNIFPETPEIRIQNCSARLYKLNSSKFLENIKITCPGWAKLSDTLTDKNKFNLSSRAHFTAQSEFTSNEFPFSSTSELKGWTQLEIYPVSTPWLKGRGKIKTDFTGVPKGFPKEWKTEFDLALNFWIPKFESLVENFSKTPWAVPAPFHVLKGRVNLDVHGKSDLNRGVFPISLKSRLKSENQKLNLDGLGTITVSDLRSKVHSKLDFNLLFSDVALELPQLNLASPPRIIPEERFIVPIKDHEETSKSKTDNFSYDFEFKTPANHPIKLLSNLAQTSIPIHVQLFLNSNNLLYGFIRVNDFQLDLFRRKAYLDHFDITLKSPSSESKIDGLIKVKYVDYTVSILILSTLGKPIIKLTSEPPLPEDKLVATLLFGKPMEELDADQAQSVGSTRAAIADSALGIASLYVLASTPIQSVGYNPTTKIFTAKLRLGEGTSLNLGAGSSGIEGIGIRKRLNSTWSITTDLSNTKSGDQSKAISTFLEWAHRY